MGVKAHKNTAPKRIQIGVISISSTRSLATDQSGQWIVKQALKEGHDVVHHQVVPDDLAEIQRVLFACIHRRCPQVLIFTGGTGVSDQDVTVEALQPYFKKHLQAFACLFAQLSFEAVDSAAIMSRAAAGIVGKTAVFCIPGSIKACKLACRELIFPEVGHIVKHLCLDGRDREKS